MLNRLKESWNLIAQTGVWLMSLIAGFVISPQMGGPQNEKSIWNLTQFVINILVGLMFILTIKYAKKVHLKRWIAATVFTLLLGLLGYFSYMNQRGQCTCRYYSKTVLIGTEFRDPQQDGNTSCEDLLKNYAGDVHEIWTSNSVNQCGLVLAVSYVSAVPLFASSLISIVQAIFIATRPRR